MGNHYKVEPSSKVDLPAKVFSGQGDNQNKINLSPILALNRKLNEGPRQPVKKCLTPENHKANEDYEGYTREEIVTFQKNFASHNASQHSLNDSKGSKGSSNFNSTTNMTNLRGSNCFKALIENRCKSPSKLENSNGKPMQKRQSTPLLKQSLSSNHLFKPFGNENKLKLAESRSFDQLRGVGVGKMELSEIKCMNNDGKKVIFI